MKKAKKYFLISVGFLSVGLGILGMFLPMLPTTPFLLLAATCFSKSSDKFFNWLINNKWFGKYISSYYQEKSIPLKIKVFSISFLWVTILSTIFFFLDNIYLKIMLVTIATLVTYHISTIKTKK